MTSGSKGGEQVTCASPEKQAGKDLWKVTAVCYSPVSSQSTMLNITLVPSQSHRTGEGTSYSITCCTWLNEVTLTSPVSLHRQPRPARAWQCLEVHNRCRSLGTNHLDTHRICLQGPFLVQAVPQLPSPAARARVGGGERRWVGGFLYKILEPSDIHLQARQRTNGGRRGLGRVLWGSVHQEGRVTSRRGELLRTVIRSRGLMGLQYE